MCVCVLGAFGSGIVGSQWKLTHDCWWFILSKGITISDNKCHQKKINDHSKNFQEVHEFGRSDCLTNLKAVCTLLCMPPSHTRKNKQHFFLLCSCLFQISQGKRSHRSTSWWEEETCISLITNLNIEFTNSSRASASSLAFDTQQKINRRKRFVSNYALETDLSFFVLHCFFLNSVSLEILPSM